MFTSQIEYSNDILFIELYGIMSKKDVRKIRKKMFSIIEEYNIDKIVIDIKNIEDMDKNAFYSFLDEYDFKYNGNLTVIDWKK